MVVKDTRGLCEDLKYVISVPDLCDVTFLVGPDRLPVYGVKAILATRSRYCNLFDFYYWTIYYGRVWTSCGDTFYIFIKNSDLYVISPHFIRFVSSAALVEYSGTKGGNQHR